MIDEVHHSGFIPSMGDHAVCRFTAGWCRYFGFDGMGLPVRRDANDMLNAWHQNIVMETGIGFVFAESCLFRE
jgi:hypothetical protein